MAKETQTKSTGGGIGFFGLLAIVFITLKLTGNIAWSWWWVLAPLWAPVTIFLTIVIIAFIIALALDLARK